NFNGCFCRTSRNIQFCGRIYFALRFIPSKYMVCDFRRTDDYSGSFLYVENVPTGNARRNNSKVFTDINIQEKVVFVIIVAVLILFGLFPKCLNDLIVPALEETLKHIN